MPPPELKPAIGILHFTAPPVVGGVEAVIGQHARLLAAAGYHVRVIAGRGGPTIGPGVEYHPVPLADARNPAVRAAHRDLDRGTVPRSFGPTVARLADDLRQAIAGLDLLIAHNVCSLPLNLPLSAALRSIAGGLASPRLRLVSWSHDLVTSSDRYLGGLHPGEPWDLVRQAWPGVAIVTVSEARRSEIAVALGVPRDAIAVAPNGVTLGAALGLHRATLRLVRRLGLADAWPLLLTPARVTPRKNLEMTIRVVAALRRGGADARAVITGAPDPHDARSSDGYLSRLRTLAAAEGVSEVVHFLADDGSRWQTPRVVSDLYRVADALFLPSRDEGFGLPILEAAACRLPIICADIPSLRELAGPDATYVDPGGDPMLIAAAVSAVLAGDRAARLRTRAGREFDWKVLFDERIEPLIRALAT